MQSHFGQILATVFVLCLFAQNAVIAQQCSFTYSCPSNQNCKHGSCTTSNSGSSVQHLQGRICRFDYECPNQYSCDADYTCYLTTDNGADRNHIEGVRCAHDGQCPYGWQCKRMTCWEKEQKNHLQGRSCIYDLECPGSFSCVNNLCYEGAQPQHIEGRVCMYDYQCPSGYGCNQYTCYVDGSQHQENLCSQQSDCPAGQQCYDYTCYTVRGNQPWGNGSPGWRGNNGNFGNNLWQRSSTSGVARDFAGGSPLGC